MDQTVIMAISSPVDLDNAYSIMMNAKMPDGTPVVMTEAASLTCARCARTDTPENCEHKRDIYPSFKNLQKQDKIKYLYGTGNMRKYAAESMGHMKPAEGTIVSKQKLEIFARRDREKLYNLNIMCRVLVITVDPNGGGSNEMSIVAAAYGDGQCYILGLGSYACRDPDQRNELMDSFMDSLEKHPWLDGAMKVFLAERNTGMQSGDLARLVKKRPMTYCVRQKEDRDYGWFTTPKEHGEWAEALRNKMQTASVFFMTDWVAVDLNTKISDFERKEKMWTKLVDQLGRMKEVAEVIKRPGQIARVRVTGKTDTNGKIQPGQNDDLAVTLAMNMSLAHKLITRKDVPTVPSSILNLF